MAADLVHVIIGYVPLAFVPFSIGLYVSSSGYDE